MCISFISVQLYNLKMKFKNNFIHKSVRSNKTLNNNLTNEVLVLYTGNCKTPRREINEKLNWETCYVHGFRRQCYGEDLLILPQWHYSQSSYSQCSSSQNIGCQYFAETYMVILKFIWESKGLKYQSNLEKDQSWKIYTSWFKNTMKSLYQKKSAQSYKYTKATEFVSFKKVTFSIWIVSQ